MDGSKVLGGLQTVLLRRNKFFRNAGGALTLETQNRILPDTYRGRGGSFFKDIYDADHVEPLQGGRFRWMLSTCLAATVGAIAILVVVYGSSDKNTADDGLLPALRSIADGAMPPALTLTPKNAEGLKWVTPKTDRMQLTTGALSTRYIIHESSKSRRDGREYVRQKPYARIVARLAPVPAGDADKIPAFNPFKLYASGQPVSANDDLDENAGSGLSRTDVSIKVVELLGGILPGEDGQELDAQETQDIVERTSEGQSAAGSPGSAASSGSSDAAAGEPLDGVAGTDLTLKPAADTNAAAWQPKSSTSQQANTTDIYKSPETPDDPTDVSEVGEVILVKVGQSDTLAKILTAAGAEPWQAHAMIDAAHAAFPESALVPGQEVRITLVPSLTKANQKEPSRFSVFSDGHDHIVSVMRNAAGEFVSSAQPLSAGEQLRAGSGDGDSPQASMLYASVYNAGLMQSLPPETILQILRVNAFDTDFRRRVRPGDTLELFFDMKEEQSTEGPPGELLYTAVNSGGAVYKFFRFRTPDGVVDYYDEEGNNSKKFLMRKPVRGDDVRLTSGFGVR